MNCTQDEEVESLKAIFYKNGEIIARKDTEGQHLTVNFDFSSVTNRVKRCDINGHSNGIDFFLGTEYPVTQSPKISVRCSYLPACIVDAVRQQVEERALALKGQSMLLDLYSLTHELLEIEIETYQTSVHRADDNDAVSQSEESSAMMERKMQVQTRSEDNSKTSEKLPDCGLGVKPSELYKVNNKIPRIKSPESSLKDISMLQKKTTHGKCDHKIDKCESDSKVVAALLQLDHMHSKQSYVKLIKKWTAELGLTGRLIFYKKLIFILLHGKSQDIRKYIVRNKTVNVDVDSKGRACKERMLTVVCEVPAETHMRFCEFSVLEIQTTESLQEFFQSFKMEDMYQDYVSPFFCSSGTKINQAHQQR